MRTLGLKSLAPLLVALCIAIIGQQRLCAALMVYTDETTFLSAAPIISTETFDEFPSPTGFFTPKVVIDSIAYQVDQPCSTLYGSPNPCWTVGISFGGSITPPNHFGANFAPGFTPHEISFEGYVTAFGFWFISGILSQDSHWEIIIHEIDSTSTVQNVTGPLPQYFGFVSDIGIRGLTVRDFPGDAGASNWSYDNVSRSAIIPEPNTFQLFAGAILYTICLGAYRRRAE